MKICNRCKETKELSEFWKDKRKKDGYSIVCKDCRKKATKELALSPESQLRKTITSSIIIENKILLRENKRICCKCYSISSLTGMVGRYCLNCANSYNKEYHAKNKDNLNEKNRKYSEDNREKLKEYAREYRIKNKETISKKRKEKYKVSKEGI